MSNESSGCSDDEKSLIGNNPVNPQVSYGGDYYG